MEIKDVCGKPKFVQTFFLAPQEKGYFVMNDMFHFIDDGVTCPNLVPVASKTIDTQPHLSSSLAEPPVVEETSVQEASPPIHTVAHIIQEPPVALVEESLEEPPKKTYASIAEIICLLDAGRKSKHEGRQRLSYDIRVSKGLLVLSAAPKHAPHSFKSAPPPSELNHVAQPAVQQSSSASMYIPESGTEAAEGYRLEEDELTSVYFGNLPANATEAEIDQEFKNFGRIKPDGIFIRAFYDVAFKDGSKPSLYVTKNCRGMAFLQ
ncbi:hypothetical protein JHK82_035241 [Glycine max]|nr:hypothetical protein JHK82_035241 [Glycine max]